MPKVPYWLHSRRPPCHGEDWSTTKLPGSLSMRLNPDFKSNVVNYLAFPNVANKSSILGKG